MRKGVERGEEEKEEELKREEKLREVRESYKLHNKTKKHGLKQEPAPTGSP